MSDSKEKESPYRPLALIIVALLTRDLSERLGGHPVELDVVDGWLSIVEAAIRDYDAENRAKLRAHFDEMDRKELLSLMSEVYNRKKGEEPS